MTTPAQRPSWTFHSMDGDPVEKYEFEINPNDQDTPTRSRTITWFDDPALFWKSYDTKTGYPGVHAIPLYGYTGLRSPQTPIPWTFRGVVRSEEQYRALEHWVARQRRVLLIDDLGQAMEIFLLSLQFEQVAGARNRHAPYRHTYTMTCLIYGKIQS